MKINKKKKTSLRFSCTSLVTLATLTVLLGGSNIVHNSDTALADRYVAAGMDTTTNKPWLPFGEKEHWYNDIWRVGNYKPFGFFHGSLLYDEYDVDEDTGELSPHINHETSITQRYVSSDTLPFNTKSKPVDGVIRVGNVKYDNIQIEYNTTTSNGVRLKAGDIKETWTKYDVNALNGELSNPHIIKTIYTVTAPAQSKFNADPTLLYSERAVDKYAVSEVRKITFIDA